MCVVWWGVCDDPHDSSTEGDGTTAAWVPGPTPKDKTPLREDNRKRQRLMTDCTSSQCCKADNNSPACCPDGSWPALIVDTERQSLCGTVETLPSGLKVYYTAPSGQSNKAVVVIYDVFGFKGGRIKSVCDQFACEGFHVIMPDLYGNEASINDHGGFASDGGKTFLKEFTNEDSASKRK